MSDSDFVRDIAGYPVSTNYESLWDLAQRQGVVCLMDYKLDYEPVKREVAQTMAVPSMYGEPLCVFLFCRGVNYLYASNKDEFVWRCKRANVEWLIPTESTP